MQKGRRVCDEMPIQLVESAGLNQIFLKKEEGCCHEMKY